MAKEKIIMVFGGGPVRKKYGKWSLPLMGQINAYTAGELYEMNPQIMVFAGGKTGDKRAPSEAELMAEIVQDNFKVLKKDIIIEGKSTNTIENFTFTLNILDKKYPNCDFSLIFISNTHHRIRIGILKRYFGVQGKFISSQSILNGKEKYKEILNRLHKTSAEITRHRAEPNFRWAFKNVLLYWLPQALQLENEKRLRHIFSLPQVKPILNQYGITNPIQDTFATKEKLRDLKRVIPDRVQTSFSSVMKLGYKNKKSKN